MSPRGFVPLVEVTRGDVVESVHFGAYVVASPEGTVVDAAGDATCPIVTRSAAKPFQAAELVASGLADEVGVTDLELAVVVGSHGGAPTHVSAVTSLMARLEVDKQLLRCGTHPPFDRSARILARGRAPSVLQNSCSGKHAAMLAGARRLGVDVERYLDPSGAWQAAIRRRVAGAAGVEFDELRTVTDGCGAPSFVLPLSAFAVAYARLAARSDPSLSRVWRASTAHPQMIAGEGRLETTLMELFPGRLLAKSGAEGVYALAALAEEGPRGVAIKIADGDDRRARTAVAIELAGRLMQMTDQELHSLRELQLAGIETLSGQVVGEVRMAGA